MLSERPNCSSNPLLIQATYNAIARRQETESADPVAMVLRAGITPDPWQKTVLRTQARQTIMLVTRQGGKSTVSSMKALHRAEYDVGSLILLLAPSYRQSKELFRKIRAARATLGSRHRIASESTLELQYSNGSRIVALPGSEQTIRGFSGVDLLVVDEAARVPDPLYQAIRPMLAVSGGDILLLSTPFGKRGFFHQEWTGAGEWERVKITAHDCPRISKEWLEQERAQIGEWWYRQEYLCEFVETTDTVFSYADIEAALDPNIQPLF
jgi:hypothetical protein